MTVENNVLIQKLAQITTYLKTYSPEQLQEGVSVVGEKLDENDFQEVDFEDELDPETVIVDLYNTLNLNGDEKVDLSELNKFETVFDAVGLSFEDFKSAVEQYNNGEFSSYETEDDIQILQVEDEETVDESAPDDLTFSDFKKIIQKNKKMDELVSEYGYKKAFNLINKDKDDVISKEEIKNISSSSESLEDVTYGEMKNFLNKNGGTKEADDKGSATEEEGLSPLVQKVMEKLKAEELMDSFANQAAAAPMSTGGSYAPQSSGGGGYTGGVSSPSGGSNYSPSGSQNVSAPTASTTSTEDTLKELEIEKEKRESTLTEKKESLSAVLDESDSEISGLKDDMDEKEELYNKALEEDAETNPELAALKEEKDENDKLLKENEEDIKNTEVELNDVTQSITEQENVLSCLNSEMESLKGSLSALQAIKTDEKNEKDVAAKISQVNSQIEAKQGEIDKANEELERLNGEKEELEGKLEELENKNTEYTNKRDELEKSIEENASEATKTALENFQKAREAFESKKSEKKATCKNEVTEAQNAVSEIDQQITELKNKELEKENSYSPVSQDAAKFLEQLSSTNGDAWKEYSKLCSTLNMSQEEAMQYLTELCTSEKWGNGVIDPVTLCAQIYQESGYNPTIYGDGGLALGLGQFHDCAVQEVNNQYGTSYTSSDRANPNKALEMMVLLSKYDFSRTGSKDAMLAMYNQGNPNGINTSAGQNYVKHVYSRL